MTNVVRLVMANEEYKQLLVRLADVDLPRLFVALCARSQMFYLGDLVQMSLRDVENLCRSKQADVADVEAFMTRSGLTLETTVEDWSPEVATVMERVLFGVTTPSDAVLNIPMVRLGLGARAAGACAGSTVGDLTRYTFDQLLSWGLPGAGKDTVHEIRYALARVGAALRDEVAIASRVDQALVRRLTVSQRTRCVRGSSGAHGDRRPEQPDPGHA